ncbi:transcription factor Opi1-domain-containing protein [Massariosphaeria phaeospora]|uniref:Transcription factor Opi1-domain-containing protein n=1 Tax=Massariosphaeria phaeospora TaxID=100035 RepID=A0A7C8MK35_9PLEO|nr:transcription factor Opi1-domain-containing protein [Massariosphaeria phaeospora]
MGSPMDTASAASVVSAGEDLGRRRELSVLSVDDPDVRLAAEALSGLGNLDFTRSPTARSLTLSARESTSEPEPLLSLLTSNHPWLGGTINGSISAYNATKGYSPRFVKYGAELIERNIGSPVVNTMSSVGRRTGVEQNLRRYLGDLHRRPSDLEQGDSDTARKRPRIRSPGSDPMDLEEAFASPRTRGGSQSSYADSLPAYDDHRSPKYEESAVVVIDPALESREEKPHASNSQQQDRRVTWSTQLIMTTSGLGVALSDASLKSLKLCLRLLRSATKHIDAVMRALSLVLEEYESALRNPNTPSDSKSVSHNPDGKLSTDPRVRQIADRMKTLSSDIWTTLQSVVHSVSRYTGGALPQNASQVVRTQLLSVPQRWQSASRSTGEAQGEEVRGANRMLAFAKEGLDMIGQITTVVDGTVQSAEAWLERMGRRGEDGERGSMAGESSGSGRWVEGEKGAGMSGSFGEKN